MPLMIGAPDVDHAIEPAHDELVIVIGDVGGKVARLAVGADDHLDLVAAEIGADVPFFIFKKPAWAVGKGERFRAADLPADLWFLLLVPPFRISTVWAYSAYDRLGVDKTGPFLVQKSYDKIADLVSVFLNDLEKASVNRFPEIGEMKERLLERGAAGALMSGSGPVVFGLFADRQGMKRAEEEIFLPPGWKAIPAKGI